MREYTIREIDLQEFKDLIEVGFEVYEVCIHKGISEIKLKSKYTKEIATIVLVNNNLRKEC